MSQLPNFPPFSVHNNEQSAGIRWRKWVEKFENLICALDISDDKRKKALLLHYVGEETYDIYDSFTDEQKGIGAMTGVGEHATSNEFNTLKQSLTDYFTPKKNTTYEVFKFRQANQNVGETIDGYHTRLRTLASTCDFHDIDREILSQIIQGCTSTRIRRRALRDNYTLDKVLSEARSLELSESRATEMEAGAAQANAVYKQKTLITDKPTDFPKRKPSKKGRKPNYKSKSGGPSGVQGDSMGHASQCRNCGGNISHKVCPAYGKECHYCRKKNHFMKVCRTRLNAKQVNCATEGLGNQDCVNNANDSSSDESIFNIEQKDVKVPSVHASIHNTDIEFLVDTGASVNIISENVFRNMCRKSKIDLQKPVPLIYAYGSSNPLNVKGYFHTEIRYRKKTAHTNFYVVESARQSRCLLGATTAQDLNIVQFAFTSLSSSISDEYAPLFDGKMGKIEGLKVKLHINQDVMPVSQRHRRIPFHVRKDLEAELERLEALDIIESVSGPTPWVSPVVVVPKKSSGIRVCIDMREANKAIGREKHPMPTVDDLITDLNSSTVFSKLDLSNAYHQLELDESSRYITTFSTHVGLKRYKRLLFGVNAASEIFQKVIADLLSDIPGARNLTDDIIIHGKSQSDHDKALKMTLDRLQAKGARLNKEKCIFSVNKITFFGHVFSDTGVSPDPKKIECIVGKEAPKNPNEVRSFLGMTQYVSRFIPQYATVTEPLRRLTRKDNTWSWSHVEQDAFEKLKLALSSTEVMVYFNPSQPTEVIVDASPVGVAAMLTQRGKVVSYASRALTDTEQRYSQTDREMLAVVYGVEHFHLYLFASEFKVITDHKPLLGIVHSQKPASARIERWRLRLMPYEFKLEYRPGKDDLNPADYMSRHPYEQPKRDNAAEAYVAFISQHAVPKSISLEEIRLATKENQILQKVMCAIQSGKWWTDTDLTPFSRFQEEFSIYDGVILRDRRLVIPSQLQSRVVDIAHHTHQGIVKTKQLIREKVWFPGIDKMVEDAVKACIPCQASYPGPNKREPVCPTPLPPGPWLEIAIDFAGPFPTGQYLLVAVDEYSRFPEIEIIPSTSAKVVLPKLSAIFARQGLPNVVKTDNGPPFQGSEFAEFAKVTGFRHRKITPLWPESNGSVERFMRTINKFIRASVVANHDWRSELNSFLMHYRATPHSATQVSPFEALTGRKMNIGFPSISLHVSDPKHVSSKIQHNDSISKHKMKAYADKTRHTTRSSLVQGDNALIKQPKINKLTPPYNPEPYTILHKNGSMVVAKRNNHYITRNSSHFKPINTKSGDIKILPEDEEEEQTLENETSSPHTPTTPHTSTIVNTSTTPNTASNNTNQTVVPRRNPSRSAGIPQKYRDYVLK